MPNILASLETGKNSLISNQIGMETTGHNLANVHTKGFSRQRTEFGTMYPDDVQPGQIGKGVRVEKVRRIYDEYLENTLRRERTGLAEWSSIYDSQTLVEVALNEPSKFGMNNLTTEFFNSWQDLSEYPEDYGLRSLVKDAGQNYTESYNQLKLDLNHIRQSIDDKVVSRVGRINEILQDVTELNTRILSIEVAGKQANDLKDRRDNLTTELAEYIDIKITEDTNGMRVSFGNYLLLEGSFSNLFDTQVNAANNDLHDVTFGGGAINF